ncbi:MAG: glycosyl hydrolase [Actinomycetota bacterium]|nr:glycosyl hydrolase [Actinomycetota bacterium]
MIGGIRMNHAHRILLATAVVGVLAVIAGCSSAGAPASPASGTALDAAVASIPHRSVTPMPTARLAKGLVPPTNRWFSGLVFGAAPQPVFPLPLSFGLTGSGFAFGVPMVTSGADAITGGFTPAITVNLNTASSVITAYDAVSVTIEEKAANGDPVGSIVIAEGSPVISYTAARDGSVDLGTRFTGSGRVRTAVSGDTHYGLLSEGTVSGTQLRLMKGQTAELFAAPTGVSPESLGSHVSALSGVSVADEVGGSTVTTTLRYRWADAGASVGLVAAMPHQTGSLVTPRDCSLGSYPSVYGTLELCSGSVLAWSSPKISPASSLDVGKLSPADKVELTTQLARDIQSTPELPTDTYFGGKALYRLANLLTLAREVGDTADTETIRTKLDDALVKWTDPTGCASRASECFVYDPQVKGVVGLAASFGSDQFNDHAFHYGYFLYAAAVAVRDQPGLRDRLRPVVDLLAADIGSPGSGASNASSRFPTRRVFDAYAGHSWASGYAPFADGNNQESSSEAINAWNGLALWAAATDNAPQTAEATWMLSAEAASAQAYWTDFPTADAAYSGYRHSVVGINWGGKRVDSTWFSANPSAMLGIQLIPMSPASSYLAGDPHRIAQNIAGATPGGGEVQFGDYLLMYSALGGRSQAATALAAARALPVTFIDDGNSRSYLLAWIMTRT